MKAVSLLIIVSLLTVGCVSEFDSCVESCKGIYHDNYTYVDVCKTKSDVATGCRKTNESLVAVACLDICREVMGECD